MTLNICNSLNFMLVLTEKTLYDIVSIKILFIFVSKNSFTSKTIAPKKTIPKKL